MDQQTDHDPQAFKDSLIIDLKAQIYDDIEESGIADEGRKDRKFDEQWPECSQLVDEITLDQDQTLEQQDECWSAVYQPM